ncbi:MAG: hypothetical protein HOV80_35725 [Polyangiaceae bacterium]|nr:hypothetical protein [Polyangiaceae bacterium]
MQSSTLLLLLSLGIAMPLVGCDQLGGGSDKAKKSSEGDDDDDKGDKKKKKKKKNDDDEDEKPTAKPTATAAATATATAAETATAAPTQTADAPPTASGSAPPAPTGPNGRSAVPTVDEWTKAPEVTVLGSDKLDCETKQVREWIRVSCKGESKERGKATNVTITKGGGKGDTFTFASGGVASLIYPFYENQALEATFRWEKTSRGFKAEWPRGAPKPTAYGIFQGGDAHLKK